MLRLSKKQAKLIGVFDQGKKPKKPSAPASLASKLRLFESAAVVAPKVRSAGAKAIGSFKVHPMNNVEKEYRDILHKRMLVGEVAWFMYEPIKLRLADNTYYTPDFMVMLANGMVEVHEVKGAVWQDDARVKFKIAADIFPFRFVAAVNKNGAWISESLNFTDSGE